MFNHTLSNKKLDDIIDGNATFVARDLRMWGKVDWENSIPRMHQMREVKEDWQKVGQPEYSDPGYAVMYSCPKCAKYEPDHDLKLQHEDYDRLLRC